MNHDLPDRLKGMLVVSEVCRAFGVTLEGANGRFKACCPFHAENTPSFNVNDTKAFFKCYGCGKGGDVLSFIQLSMNGAEFPEVLRRACEFAGLDYERENGGDETRLTRARRIGDILTAYMQLAQGLWTPERREQIRQRKAYVVEDVIKRWNLGVAPTRVQCERAGITADELRLVGLLRSRPAEYGGGEKMHFWDSMIIPHVRHGRCVYLADRAFTDERKPKILNMPLPGADGTGGLPMPVAFNLEALWDARARENGVLLVEARLDAIACCERGHPAVSFLSSPSVPFAVEVSKCAGVRLFYAPDGTGDMTAMKRATGASILGYDVKCCRLPEGKDPDDLTALELAAVKAAAGSVLDEWQGALREAI